MLYMMGMSHAISVLRAIDAGVDASHDTYGGPEHQEAATWVDRPLPCIFGETGLSAMRVFLARAWSATLQDGVLAAPESYWKLLGSMGADTERQTLVSFVGGNEHSVLSMVEHSSPFDFYTDEYTLQPMIAQRQPIPLGVMEQLVEKRLRNTVALLTAARVKHPKTRIVHVMPPPPISSEDLIRRQPEIFRHVFETSGITPISIRVKIYRVFCRVLMTKLASIGISCIRHPEGVVDQYGGLLNDFAQGCTHGNESYGRRVAQQLALILKD
jgi:hypothetical protein